MKSLMIFVEQLPKPFAYTSIAYFSALLLYNIHLQLFIYFNFLLYY